MPVPIRTARASDVDALVAIENAAFGSDRISRRSFRRLVGRETVVTLVTGDRCRLHGYAMVLLRKGSGVARLYSIAVDPVFAGAGLGRALLDAAGDAALAHGRPRMRLEVRADNLRAIAAYERAGYRRIGRVPAYYADGMEALKFEKALRDDGPAGTAAPHHAPTGGACCLMMAKAHFGTDPLHDPASGTGLGRPAASVAGMARPAGCEPFDLAMVAARQGLSAEIIVSLQAGACRPSAQADDGHGKREPARDDLRSRAESLAIPVTHRAFDIHDIRAALAGGRLAMVMVAGDPVLHRGGPRWVLAIGDDGRHIIVRDPGIADERGEWVAGAAGFPIPYDTFMGMAQLGRGERCAAILLGKRMER